MKKHYSLTRAHALARRDHFQHDREQMNNLLGYHDTVEELGSFVQQAQLRAGAKTNRGSGTCAESRTQLLSCAVEKFLRDKPSTMLHSDGTRSNHGQQRRAGICAQAKSATALNELFFEQPELRQARAPSLSMKCNQREPRMRSGQVQRQIAGTTASILLK